MRERIKRTVLILAGIVMGFISGIVCIMHFAEAEVKKQKEIVESERKSSEKYLTLFLLMNQWVKIKQKKKNLETYFKKNGYKKIAIYGMGFVGETLVEELKETDISVSYGIDKRKNTLQNEIEMISLEDTFKPVDVIVVTAVTYFDEIEKDLVEKVNFPIISLDDVLEEV